MPVETFRTLFSCRACKMNELLLSFLFHIFDVDSVPSQILKKRFVSDWYFFTAVAGLFDYTSQGIISYLMQMESYVFNSPPRRKTQI